jgi:hypothetical protein
MQDIKCFVFYKISWVNDIRCVFPLSKGSVEVLAIAVGQDEEVGQLIESQGVIKIVVDRLFVVVFGAEV